MATKKITLNELRRLVKQVINENEFDQGGDKRITISYRVSDEESTELGDYKEQGWKDQEGVSMVPDEYDLEDGITAVDKAVDFLKDNGATEASSSHFNNHVWYSTTDADVDYGSGEETYYDYHLKGFSNEEKEEIFNRIKQQSRFK
jgi:hypothetical protein